MKALAALLALAPGGAWAQDDPCAALWARLGTVPLGGVASGPLSGEVRQAEDGWCEARDIRSGRPEDRVVVAVDALRWRGEGLDALAAGTGLPTSVEVQVDGYRIVPNIDDPLWTWVQARQTARAGIDGRLAASWDGATRELRITEASIDFPGPSVIRADATVAGVDLSSPAAARASLRLAGVVALDVEVVTHGLFETYVLPTLAYDFLDEDPDPQTAFELLRAAVLGPVEDLPPAIFPDPTRAEAAEVLAALPNPTGRLTLALRDEGPGLGAVRFARFALTGGPASPGDLWPALDGVTVTLGWEPLPPAD